VRPEIVCGQLRNRSWFCDLLAPLRLILGVDASADEHEARLFAQVAPVLDALVGRAE
jgi:hypothetical protein